MPLDYSQFHSLDHRIGSRFCREMPNFPTAPKGWGNVWRHARYTWDYRYDHLHPKALAHKWVSCKMLHRHVDQGGEEIVLLGMPSRVRRWCIYCHREPSGERAAQLAYEAEAKLCTCGRCAPADIRCDRPIVTR